MRDGSSAKFGALCGIGIPIADYSKVSSAVYKLKLSVLGKEYADNYELKGKKLLNPRTFRLREQNPMEKQKNIDFVKSLIQIFKRYKLPVFGCVSFDQTSADFKCSNTDVLDKTFKSICERINMYMKREHDKRKAIIVFDNRDHATDEKNATAMTKYLVRTVPGKTMSTSILEIPMFAISQAHNIGLQLADIVTTIIGLHASGTVEISDLYQPLHQQIYTWKDNYGKYMSTLRWIEPRKRQ